MAARDSCRRDDRCANLFGNQVKLSWRERFQIRWALQATKK
jgi:hypothetical protein